MQRVYLVPYDPRWAEEFAREASGVKSALGDMLVAMHHIGSTAIPGIPAKPIIDILAAVHDLSLLDERSERLGKLGYEAMGELGIVGRRYFRKDNEHGDRTHQIHAFQVPSPQIVRHLAFRDFMNAHPECASQYAALKERLAATYPADIGSYTEAKSEFIAQVDERAAAWLTSLPDSP